MVADVLVYWMVIYWLIVEHTPSFQKRLANWMFCITLAYFLQIFVIFEKPHPQTLQTTHIVIHQRLLHEIHVRIVFSFNMLPNEWRKKSIRYLLPNFQKFVNRKIWFAMKLLQDALVKVIKHYRYFKTAYIGKFFAFFNKIASPLTNHILRLPFTSIFRLLSYLHFLQYFLRLND